MKRIEDFSLRVDNVTIVNVTPHPLTFLSMEGNVVIVPSPVEVGEKSCDWVVNARAEEAWVGEGLVRTNFVGTPEGDRILTMIAEWAEAHSVDNLRIVGSIIAVNAYPGRVVGMCPAPGFERVAPAEKRMTTAKFTVA